MIPLFVVNKINKFKYQETDVIKLIEQNIENNFHISCVMHTKSKRLFSQFIEGDTEQARDLLVTILTSPSSVYVAWEKNTVNILRKYVFQLQLCANSETRRTFCFQFWDDV